MKQIVIQDFVTFLHLEDRPTNVFIGCGREWNVYRWNEEAIGYLEENCISYKVIEA